MRTNRFLTLIVSFLLLAAIGYTASAAVPEFGTDNSASSGVYGSSYTFNITITDDTDPYDNLTVYVNWTHDGTTTNDTMTGHSGDYFTKTITLGSNITNMTYRFDANDTTPDFNSSSTGNVIINKTTALKDGSNFIALFDDINASALNSSLTNCDAITYFNTTNEQYNASFISGFSDTEDPENYEFYTGNHVIIDASAAENYVQNGSGITIDANISLIEGENWVGRLDNTVNASTVNTSLTNCDEIYFYNATAQTFSDSFIADFSEVGDPENFDITAGMAACISMSGAETLEIYGW